jgi:predicted AAA+ superfamily ATPase
MSQIHVHHIVPKHRGGTNNKTNLIEVTVTQHAIFHYCEWKLWKNEYDRIAWKSLSNQISLTEAQKLAHLEGCKKGAKSLSKETRVFASKMQSRESKVLGGKGGGKSCYEQKKGMFSLSKEKRQNIAKNTINKKYKCLETGFISTLAGLTKYQKNRNIDSSKREPIED